jgi:RHH-type transcriptional regulator, rel operon repressor / antitoxin RelB
MYMLAIRLDPEIEERLVRLAKNTGRTMAFCARKAIEEYIDDMEDHYLAVDAIREPGRIYSVEETKRSLGLDY